MDTSDQLRRQNQSLLLLIEEIDLALLSLDELIDLAHSEPEIRTLWAKLLSGARARDTANHAGDMISGAKT